MKLKTSRLWPMLAFSGLLAIGHAGAARAQMINPFGVNNGMLLTADDYKLGGAAAKQLFSDPPAVGRYETWSNPVSGNHGRLTILEMYTSKDMPCRKVKSHVVYKKTGALPRDVTLNACQLPTGEWKIVS
jgi:surface antigen